MSTEGIHSGIGIRDVCHFMGNKQYTMYVHIYFLELRIRMLSLISAGISICHSAR